MLDNKSSNHYIKKCEYSQFSEKIVHVHDLVMGPGQKNFQVNFLWLVSGQVGSAMYGLDLNLEINFP